jgi:hypothetical protein
MIYSFLQVFDLTPDTAQYILIITDFCLITGWFGLRKMFPEFVAHYFFTY